MIDQIPALNLTGTSPSDQNWHRETSFLRSFPPEADPNIFVIGAYTGTITELLIDQMPHANYWLFEPQDWACQALGEKFEHLANVNVCDFGLGDHNGVLEMAHYETYFCSFCRGPTPLSHDCKMLPNAKIVEFGDFMRQEGLKDIYHASLNIESYEFVLIPHLMRTGWLRHFQTMGISWHDGGGSLYSYLGKPLAGWDEVHRYLEQHHRLVLSIDNWESWVRK